MLSFRTAVYLERLQTKFWYSIKTLMSNNPIHNLYWHYCSWHSNTRSTNGMIWGAGLCVCWPMADGGVFRRWFSSGEITAQLHSTNTSFKESLYLKECDENEQKAHLSTSPGAPRAGRSVCRPAWCRCSVCPAPAGSSGPGNAPSPHLWAEPRTRPSLRWCSPPGSWCPHWGLQDKNDQSINKRPLDFHSRAGVLTFFLPVRFSYLGLLRMRASILHLFLKLNNNI